MAASHSSDRNYKLKIRKKRKKEREEKRVQGS